MCSMLSLSWTYIISLFCASLTAVNSQAPVFSLSCDVLNCKGNESTADPCDKKCPANKLFSSRDAQIHAEVSCCCHLNGATQDSLDSVQLDCSLVVPLYQDLQSWRGRRLDFDDSCSFDCCKEPASPCGDGLCCPPASDGRKQVCGTHVQGDDVSIPCCLPEHATFEEQNGLDSGQDRCCTETAAEGYWCTDDHDPLTRCCIKCIEPPTDRIQMEEPSVDEYPCVPDPHVPCQYNCSNYVGPLPPAPTPPPASKPQVWPIWVAAILSVICTCLMFSCCICRRFRRRPPVRSENSFRDEGELDIVISLQRQHMPFSSVRNRVALLIGNNNYSNYQKLHCSHNDVISLKDKLESRLGFDVISVLGAKGEAFFEARDALLKRNWGLHGSIFLFFFSGHAIQRSGENYMLGIDAGDNSDQEAGFVSLSLFLKDLDRVNRTAVAGKYGSAPIKDAIFLIVLDACRTSGAPCSTSGCLPQPSAGLAATTVSEDIIPLSISKKGTRHGAQFIMVFACAPGKSSEEDITRRHGYFTEQLINFIDVEELNITEMLEMVFKATQEQTHFKQAPWLHSNCHEASSIILNPRDA